MEAVTVQFSTGEAEELLDAIVQVDVDYGGDIPRPFVRLALALHDGRSMGVLGDIAPVLN